MLRIIEPRNTYLAEEIRMFLSATNKLPTQAGLSSKETYGSRNLNPEVGWVSGLAYATGSNFCTTPYASFLFRSVVRAL